MSNSTDCFVCCEPYKGHNKEIKCKYCDFSCCKNCGKTYILGSVNEARCMKTDCKKVWDREFLIENFSYTFVNTDYKKHRQKLLYDLEQAKFDETIMVIDQRKELYKVRDKILEITEKIKKDETYKKNKKEIQDLKDETTRFKYRNKTPNFLSHNNLNNQIAFLTKMLKYKTQLKELTKDNDITNDLLKERNTLRNKEWELMQNNKVKLNKEKFFGHCPEENCRGLIKNDWTCALCEIVVCRTCKIKIAEKDTSEKDKTEIRKNHTCDKDYVKSLEEIKKSTKPCPQCKVPIIRSSGCAQIWCTECHIAFDYKTGEVVTSGVIHNPHYLEWRRQNNVTDNNVCGERTRTLTYHLENKLGRTYRDFKYTNELRELVYFLEDVRHRKIEGLNQRINADKTLEFRIDFLRNKITEKKFKQKLQIREKEKMKLRDHCMIFDMLDTTCQEYLFKLKNDIERNSNDKNEKITKEFLELVENLILYTNESFDKLTIKYKNKIPKITKIKKYNRDVYNIE